MVQNLIKTMKTRLFNTLYFMLKIDKSLSDIKYIIINMINIINIKDRIKQYVSNRYIS